MMKSRITRSAVSRSSFGEACAAVARLAYVVALLLERLGDEAADVGIVVDDKDRARRRRLRRLRSRRRPAATSAPASVGLAEQQADRGAFAGRALDPRRAARLPRHAVDHRQAKAGALADFLGGEEGLERALGDFGRHADAGVADGQLDIVAVRELGVAVDLHRPGREV